jgi:hypothetical protein
LKFFFLAVVQFPELSFLNGDNVPSRH